MRASRWLAHAVAGALMLGAGSVRAAEPDVCAPWPGELSPLPSVAASDRFAARWAQLRFGELSALASSIAATDPSAAYRIWEHARCLAPDEASAEQALAQLAPAREIVPAPVVARAAPTPPAPAPAPAPSPERREPPKFAAVDAVIADASSALAQARFREVLDAGGRARSLLDAMGPGSEVRRRQARVEVMAGTAELALDLEDDAARSLRRALRADPALALDDNTPPKVRRLLQTVRDSVEKAQQP